MINKLIVVGLSFLLFNSCSLRTRSDVSPSDQYQVYNRKNVGSQPTVSKARTTTDSQLSSSPQQITTMDERNEEIRNYTGRIETLENKIQQLQKEKETINATTAVENQKLQAMQEAIGKMESQLQILQNENAQLKAEKEARKSSDEIAAVKPVSATKNAAATTAPAKSKPTHEGAEAPKLNVKSNPFDIAQEHFAKKEWKKAILSYQKYVDDFPKGKTVPDAKYRIGVCFQELGMKEEAAAFYEEVVAQYPKSEAGKRSKIRLSKIKK